MTAALFDALRKRGITVTIAKSPTIADVRAAAGDTPSLMVSGSLIEWEPDMALALMVLSFDAESVASSHAVLQSPRFRSSTRKSALPELAEVAIGRLIREMRLARRRSGH